MGAFALLVMLAGLAAGGAEQGLDASARQSARLVLLDNCDSDFRVPPFNDAILLVDREGAIIRRIGGLNVCQNVGGNRALSVSEDGRFFVVCENVANRLTAYETASGKVLWSLPGAVTSVTIAGDRVYVLTSARSTYGESILALDHEGQIVKQVGAGGYDIAVDPSGRFFWLVGKDIKRCDANLQVVLTIDPITWCAVSADVTAEGSLWVAERRHSDVGGSPNRLLEISPKGVILREVPLTDVSPRCVRVDRSDGSVWVTGRTMRKALVWSALWRWPPQWRTDYEYAGRRTRKYSAQGELLVDVNRGGHSIDLVRSDGSVWIAGESGLLHYSRDGTMLAACGGVSADQKWIAVVPEEGNAR